MGNRLLPLGLAVVVTFLVPIPAISAGQVRGRVVDSQGKGVQAAVFLASAQGVTLNPSPKNAKLPAVYMVQKDKKFYPGALAVEVGESVVFRNQDAVFHNVFSVSKGNAFDLGLFKAPLPGKSNNDVRTFSKPGKIDVFCNIHPDMGGVVMVVAHPYHANANIDGSFILPLPDRGSVLVKAMDGWGNEAQATLSLPYSGELKLVFNNRRTQAAQHLTKTGQAYPKPVAPQYQNSGGYQYSY